MTVKVPPRRAGEADVMAIDPATRASLEIEKTTGGQREGSLLGAIDRTITAAQLNNPGWIIVAAAASAATEAQETAVAP